MKITELRCSACKGTMKVDPDNPNYAVCEYCGTRFLIEWDKTGLNGGAGEGNPSLKRMPQPIQYQRIEPVERKKTGWEVLGWKWSIAMALTIAAAAGVMYGPAIYQRYKMDHDPNVALEAVKNANGLGSGAGAGAVDGMADGISTENLQLTGILKDFAEYVFNQPAEAITEKQLAGIKWLEFKTSMDFREIGYSLDNPFENEAAELIWVKFPRDDYYDVDTSCLPLFTGLKRLGTIQSVPKEDLQGISLEGISGYFDSLEEVAAAVADTSAIRAIGMAGSNVSLQGAENFPNLESLSLDCDQIDEPKTLVNMKSLKALSVDMYDEGMDFSVFGMMPWLENVTISSKKLKDFSFVSGMSGLKELHLSYGTFLNLDPLKNCAGLESLSVERCDELKDMSAMSGLTNLKKLKIDLPYGCPEPDLSALTAVEELYLESFEKTGFLRNMPNLKTMTLDSCRVDTPSDFDGLVNLTTLNCTSFGAAERDYGFVTRLPAIEHLNLRGTKTYEDISGIFNLPTLKYLDIGSMECEINFDKIQENTSLETLVMDHIKLYKNVSVSGGNGIYSINWDDVSLVENIAFLGKLKGLRALSIRENELTDLGFASSLAALRSIDFADNYVTDLSPLSELKMLREVTCTENPVSNFEVLSESVMVIK